MNTNPKELLEGKCRNCAGEGWVCENHRDQPWEGSGHSDNCGAGAPCPVCNDLAAPDLARQVTQLEAQLAEVREGLERCRQRFQFTGDGIGQSIIDTILNPHQGNAILANGDKA